MAANPSLPTNMGRAPRPARASETHALPVPAAWRTGQIVVMLLIAAFAVFYRLKGWQTPPNGTDQGPVTTADYFGFIVLAGLAWFTTPIAITIAVTSFKEALRRRWVLGFLGFATIVLLFSPMMTFVQLGEEQHSLQDLGTGFIIAMTVLIAIFLGVTLVPPEIDRRIIFTILSKPVNSREYLVGKFLGLCLTLLFCMVVLGVVFLGVYVGFNIHKNGLSESLTSGTASAPYATLGFQSMQLFKALILNYGQLVVLGSLSMLLSLLVTPITAITFSFLAYFGGQMSSYWNTLGAGSDPHGQGESARNLSGPMQNMVKFLYYALPRMDHFDVRQSMVTDNTISLAQVWKAWSSGLVYVGVLLIIGHLLFSEREF